MRSAFVRLIYPLNSICPPFCFYIEMILGINVAASQGEQSVKSYQCTEYKSKFFGVNAMGYLEVTNKRVLFQAMGQNLKGWSVIHNEVSISEVSDIKIYKGSTFSLMVFVIGFIIVSFLASILFTGLSTMINGTLGTLAGFIGWVYGIYRVYLYARNEAFTLIVNTKGGTGNVVYLSGMSPFNNGNSAASKALVTTKPGADAELMLREIGAVIMDVQNLGDYAIEKWRPQGDGIQ